MKKGFLMIETLFSMIAISIISIIGLALFARTIIMFNNVLEMEFNKINVENSIINLFRFFRDDIKVDTVTFKDAGYKKYFEFERKNGEKAQLEKISNYLKLVYIDVYNKKTYEYLYTGKEIDINKIGSFLEFNFEEYNLNIYSREW
ncbi:hypothetical protein XO12_08565 [Marinitoga sp. 1154]|uniref:hypothetical protein n=1 Tax=Marinitoga sp. 1154 TaxID=1643335 RepID=UPI001586F62B|nr:hypothetical protein [Marinitoga sp. 1154]NUV00137.1 hypothetical protein [Marinitoga sp. 1154]